MGNEVVLGFGFERYQELKRTKDFGKEITKIEEEKEIEEFRDMVYDLSKSLEKELAGVTKRVLERAGFQVTEQKEGYTIAETPAGTRTFSNFFLQLYYDPYELGETFEDSLFGISLSGRYKPVFLDWKENGNLGNININKEMMRLIKIAREEISALYPVFKKADIFIRQEFY